MYRKTLQMCTRTKRRREKVLRRRYYDIAAIRWHGKKRSIHILVETSGLVQQLLLLGTLLACERHMERPAHALR